jgi:transcriptional regulator with XRE-family HTH domain
MIKIDLFPLWHRKEIELGRELTVREVAKATGLDSKSVSNLKRGTTQRFDAPVLAALCQYFGVPEGPVPFITVRYNGEGQ